LDSKTGKVQEMTDDAQYEIEHVFGERKAINKRFLVACEQKIRSTPSTENPTKWVIGKLAFQELDDVWDNFERMALTLNYSIQNLDHRMQWLEEVAIKLGAKVNSKEIASAVEFTKEFKRQIEETRKSMEAYKKKMAENDLAT
jgi:predicted  nucleic acid-binding Zn-ribbon protein